MLYNFLQQLASDLGVDIFITTSIYDLSMKISVKRGTHVEHTVIKLPMPETCFVNLVKNMANNVTKMEENND